MRIRNFPKAGMRHQHQGVILAAVLASILVMSLTVLASVRAHIGRYRARQDQVLKLQCELLAEAGIRRALVCFEENPNYREETWKPSFPDSRFSQAEVEISVSPTVEDPAQAAIVASATCWRGPHRFATRTLHTESRIGPTGAEE